MPIAPDPTPICTPKGLPLHLQLHAADLAIRHNPANAPFAGMAALSAVPLPPERIAVFTGKRWQPGTTLTVGFLEPVDSSLQNLILSHMSAWSSRANIKFALSQSNPTIRITLQGDGYWSYIGTDLLSIPASEPTMSLQGWSLQMPDSECRRVIRHETGHSLGSPHEHARPAIVALLDPAKTTAYFEATQGWSADVIAQQILTPLDESQLMGTTPEQDSIMCYQFPGQCTVSGQPIPGGNDITEDDYAFMASIYPGVTPPTPPPPPPPTPTPTPPPPQPPPQPNPPPAPPGELVAAVNGPPVTADIGPGHPLMIALPLPGPARFRIEVSVAGATGLLRFARIPPFVEMIDPKGKPEIVHLNGNAAVVKTPTPGTWHVKVRYALQRRISVRFTA